MIISFRKYVVFIIIPITAVAVLLYYVASNNVDQFFEHESELAETSINSTNSLIQQYLKDLRRNMGHFATNHQDELQQLIDSPDNQKLQRQVHDLVGHYFPGSATYTLADSEGRVILNDIDTLIGKGCRENIRLFTISNKQSDAQLRIHSDRLNYHFDIMHEMHARDGRIVIFFVSFEPDRIAQFISNIQLPGHQLMILKQNADSLIEVTEVGARVKLNRDTSLTNAEHTRILASMDVADTLWQLVDILDESRIQQTKFIVFRDFGIIFASFLLGVLLAFVAITKHERLRFIAESKLGSK